MKRGDIVRLKRPFAPIIGSTQSFRFGQLVELITELPEDASDLEAVDSEIIELLIHLYDPETGILYRDQWGDVATFSVYPDEVEMA